MALSKIDVLLKKLSETFAGSKLSFVKSVKEASGHGEDYDEATKIITKVLNALKVHLSDVWEFEALNNFANGKNIDPKLTTLELLDGLLESIKNEMRHVVSDLGKLDFDKEDRWGASPSMREIKSKAEQLVAGVDFINGVMEETAEKEEPDYPDQDDPQDDGPDGGHSYPDTPRPEYEGRNQ